MKKTKTRPSKRCRKCGKVFYREKWHNDYTWKIKKFCTYMCASEYNISKRGEPVKSIKCWNCKKTQPLINILENERRATRRKTVQKYQKRMFKIIDNMIKRRVTTPEVDICVTHNDPREDFWNFKQLILEELKKKVRK